MKPLLKSLTFTFLGMALIIGFQLRDHTFTEVMAQISGRFVKPTTIIAQQTARTSTAPNTNSQIPYAIPIGVDIFSVVGSNYSNGNGSIESSVNSGSMRTVPMIQDLNGDGLADMVYSFNARTPDQYGTFRVISTDQYVMLNNGNGYDLVYTCRFSHPIYGNPSYTGDCAQ